MGDVKTVYTHGLILASQQLAEGGTLSPFS